MIPPTTQHFDHVCRHALRWQCHLVTIRFSLAFVESELPVIEKEGNDISAILPLLGYWREALSNATAHEVEAFKRARTADRDATFSSIETSALICESLEGLRNSFKALLSENYRVVQALPQDSMLCFLLMACGADTANATSALMDLVDELLDQLDTHIALTAHDALRVAREMTMP